MNKIKKFLLHYCILNSSNIKKEVLAMINLFAATSLFIFNINYFFLSPDFVQSFFNYIHPYFNNSEIDPTLTVEYLSESSSIIIAGLNLSCFIYLISSKNIFPSFKFIYHYCLFRMGKYKLPIKAFEDFSNKFHLINTNVSTKHQYIALLQQLDCENFNYITRKNVCSVLAHIDKLNLHVNSKNIENSFKTLLNEYEQQDINFFQQKKHIKGNQ